MGLPSRELLQATIDTALAEAELIATKAKANPTGFIRPEVGNWGGRYVSSRYEHVYNASDRGKFDLWDQQVFSQVKGDFPGVQLDIPTQEQLDALAEGEVAECDAVFKQIASMRLKFSEVAVSAYYANYGKALATRDMGAGRGIYFALFRGLLMEGMKLRNTMLRKMPQAENRPLPVPGPGEHLDPANNPYDDDRVVIHKDHPYLPSNDLKMAWAQFKNLMEALLKEGK